MAVALHLLSRNMAYDYLEDLINRYPKLRSCKTEIWKTYQLILECYKNNGTLLIAGNGGSAADADHMVGELMKGFKLKREISKEMITALENVDTDMGRLLADKLQQTLPAIALHSHSSLNTAYANDVDSRLIFAQQVYGYGKTGDVFFAISTSGNSENIIYAAITAKAKGMTVVGLTGADGGDLKEYLDVAVRVPEKEAYMAQELHLPIYHCLCLMLEAEIFGEEETEDE